MNKQINTALAIVVIIIIASAFGGLILHIEKEQNIASSIQQNVPIEKISKNASIPKIGEDCTSHWINGIETEIDNKDSLQCYFYNDVKNATDTTRPRKGVWIYPNSYDGNKNLDYAAYIKNFKQFSNGTILFSYPTDSRIADDWKNTNEIILSHEYLFPNGIRIDLYKNIFDMNNFLASIKKNHSRITSSANCPVDIPRDNNGTCIGDNSNDMRVDAMAISNQIDDDIYLIFPRGDKYFLVTAYHTGIPLNDFIIEALIQSIKIK